MFASALLVLAAFPARAQDAFDRPPPVAPPRPLSIAAPFETTLANGLRVVVASRPGVPLVTAELTVLSGSEADPPGRAGLAALGASLLTQGTTARSAPRFAAAAEALGGSIDGSAAKAQTVVTTTVLTTRLDAALALVAEAVRTPAFAPAEIERTRQQALDALKVAYADPGRVAATVAERLAYDGGWGLPTSGTPASLPRIRRADLVAWHARTFRPDRALLVFAGDLDPASGRALAERHFGSWRKPVAAPADTAPPTAARAQAPVAIDVPQAGQAAVVVAVALPARDRRDEATASVLNAVLGGGYSSRLSSEIRIRRGLSYGASSRADGRRSAALWRASVQTRNEAAAEVAGLVDAALDALIATPVDADELAARKATWIGGFSRSVETTAGLAAAIRSRVVEGRSPADLGARIGDVEAVDAAAVQRYAGDHLGPAARRLVVAGDTSAFGAALAAARPGLATVPLESLDVERPPPSRRR